MLKAIKRLHDRGSIRRQIWENDAKALEKLVFISPDFESWVEKILKDPNIPNGNVATTTLK